MVQNWTTEPPRSSILTKWRTFSFACGIYIMLCEIYISYLQFSKKPLWSLWKINVRLLSFPFSELYLEHEIHIPCFLWKKIMHHVLLTAYNNTCLFTCISNLVVFQITWAFHMIGDVCYACVEIIFIHHIGEVSACLAVPGWLFTKIRIV